MTYTCIYVKDMAWLDQDLDLDIDLGLKFVELGSISSGICFGCTCVRLSKTGIAEFMMRYHPKLM